MSTARLCLAEPSSEHGGRDTERRGGEDRHAPVFRLLVEANGGAQGGYLVFERRFNGGVTRRWISRRPSPSTSAISPATSSPQET